MSITKLLQQAKYVVDGEGRRTAVVFDYELWDELLTLLEDLEDVEEIQALRASGEEAIPWEQAKAQLRSDGIDI